MNYDSYYSDDINSYEVVIKLPTFRYFKLSPVLLYTFTFNLLKVDLKNQHKNINLKQCIASER